MSIVLAAHGTRSAAGRDCVEQIRRALQESLREPVRLGWVDVCGPHLADVLSEDDLVLPAFLGKGHHVSVDIPAAARGVPGARVTPHLGAPLPGDPLLQALSGRVHEAGGPWPTTIIGWAGSTHAHSRGQTLQMAADLTRHWRGLGVRVELATPREVPEVLADARRRGGGVGIASYLLAPGHFHSRLASSGADAISAPLGDHPAIIEALAALARGEEVPDQGLQPAAMVAMKSEASRAASMFQDGLERATPLAG
ncbi:sirohydrochlorin chelatase [Luteococcus sp. OSA5]|uniref:sirohydrochlorin chelatase n=1 Tax=Luteococcus sp. OSA5 TaxID=3401630 RepID=UPI003B436B41